MTDGDSMTINNLCDSAKGTFVTLDDYLPLAALGIDPLLSVSLASCIGSLRPVYEAWKAGNLTMSVLSDVPGTHNSQRFFSAPQASSVWSSPRSSLCSLWKVAPDSGSSEPLRSTTGSASLPILRPPSYLPTGSSSRSSKRVKRPLVLQRPRGHVSSVVPGTASRSLSARSVGVVPVSLLFKTISPLLL